MRVCVCVCARVRACARAPLAGVTQENKTCACNSPGSVRMVKERAVPNLIKISSPE
jgi:hypothetical protein